MAIFTEDQKTANRLVLAYKDMQDAMRYLDVHDDLAERQSRQGNSEFFDHCEAILIAAIVAYCRPFKKSNSDGFADRRLIGEALAAVRENEAVHNLVLAKRDTFIAHSDWAERNTEVVRLDEGSVLRRSPIPSVHEGLDLTKFRRLIADVGYECRRKAFALDLQQG